MRNKRTSNPADDLTPDDHAAVAPSRAERMRQAVAASTADLLRILSAEQSIPKVLQRIGTATDVGRVQIYENVADADGGCMPALRYDWNARGTAPAGSLLAFDGEGSIDFRDHVLPSLASGKAKHLLARSAPARLRQHLERTGTRSLLLAPVLVDGKWWGEIGFADCRRARVWSQAETGTITMLAEMIGAALARAYHLRDLSDANRIVENSPVILFRISCDPPYSLVYLSRNVSHFGYAASKLMAASARYIDLFHPDERASVLGDVQQVASGTVEQISEERRLRTAAGQYVWVEVRARALDRPARRQRQIEGILLDIDARKTAQVELARYSQTDPVTGLPNRRAFVEELDRMIRLARRSGIGFAVHYIDLDRFKDINDVLGHSKGDELLKAVGARLAELRRTAADLVGRLGDDEFAFLQAIVAEASDAGAFAEQLLDTVARPYVLGSEVHVTASVGISVFSPDMRGAEDLLKRADVALDRAKESGRNQYHFHSETLDTATVERVTLGGDLRHAVALGELRLEYQPQVDIETGRIIGLEALARWHHPTRGVIAPSRFIPIAEKNGIIVPLGYWVIDEVCRQIVAWRRDGIGPPTVALNVSAEQLKSADFTAELMARLEKWHIEPTAIELELTETVLMETTRQHGQVIENLRTRGVALAIDDFGTGYSSLAYLRAYPVNHIKIAQAFIEDIRAESGDIAIVRAAVSLGRELGISVIAEGVQTQLQFGLVREAGCRYVQGFLFSRPLPPREAAARLRRGMLVRAQAPQPGRKADP